MRVKVLFWNYDISKGALMLGESRKGDPLARLAKAQNVDIVILADCILSTVEILDSFSEAGLECSPTDLPHKKVRFFRRSTGPDLDPVCFDKRMGFYSLSQTGFEDVLIGAIHFYDRRNLPLEQSRHSKVFKHYLTLIEAEQKVKHNRTLLVGDFNMTPHELGMVDPGHGFGALMTWDLARVYSDPKLGGSPRFYHPMWSLMGRPEAPGTYYWSSNDPYNVHWSCLDGVIARPSLQGVFRDETLTILATIPDRAGQEIPLVRLAEKHWRIEFSDHLPIVFELKLREKEPGANHA